MKEITLTLKVITPLFMGGADMEPEIRSQSINGVIRWWFRTLGGSFEEEKKLFGWGGENSQKGGVKIIVENKDLQKDKYSKIFTDQGYPEQNGINYLSFSLDQRFRKDQSDKIQRKYIKEEQEFKIRILFSPLLVDKEIKKFFGKFNFSIYKLDEKILTKKDNLNSWLNKVQNGRNGRFLAKNFNDNYINNNALKILNILGFTMMAFRSYMKPDYDNAKNIIQNRNAGNEIKRAIFGLPINFFFSSIRNGDMVNLVKVENGRDIKLRRASPIIFKVIENNNTNTGLIIFLKEKQFIPNSQNIKIKLKNVQIKAPDYSLIRDYLESLKNSGIIQEVY